MLPVIILFPEPPHTHTFCPGGMSIERSVSGQNNPESGSSLHFIPDYFDRTWTPNAMRIVNAGPCVRYCHSCVSCVMTYVFLLYYFIFLYVLLIGCMFVAYRVFMCCLSFLFFRCPTYTFCPGGMSIERSVSGQNNPE